MDTLKERISDLEYGSIAIIQTGAGRAWGEGVTKKVPKGTLREKTFCLLIVVVVTREYLFG